MNFRHFRFLLFSLILMAQSIVAGSSTQKEKSLLSNFQKDPDAYVFSYFTGNGEDGLHLMYSHDGIIWQTLNHGNSLLKPTIGKEKLMRDPSIVRDMQGIYHMVWTTGWNGNSIGYASSKDLINWSEQAEIPVMANEPTVRNTLAPELLYDKLSGKFYIVWASTIPGRFPENGKSEDGYNHRLYYTTTKDFKKFEKTSLLYDPGFSVIDACFLKKKGTYYMFLKNETLDPVEKNIRYTSAGRMKGFPKEVSGPISGKAWAEGPTAVQIRDYTYIYWDNYTEGHYGGVRCRNLSKPQWEDITGIIRFPKGVRHGSAFKIDNKTLVNLQNLEK